MINKSHGKLKLTLAKKRSKISIFSLKNRFFYEKIDFRRFLRCSAKLDEKPLKKVDWAQNSYRFGFSSIKFILSIQNPKIALCTVFGGQGCLDPWRSLVIRHINSLFLVRGKIFRSRIWNSDSPHKITSRGVNSRWWKNFSVGYLIDTSSQISAEFTF